MQAVSGESSCNRVTPPPTYSELQRRILARLQAAAGSHVTRRHKTTRAAQPPTPTTRATAPDVTVTSPPPQAAQGENESETSNGSVILSPTSLHTSDAQP